jgi:hypothetical protein
MIQLFQLRKIDNHIADRDAHARAAAFRLENAEGKIL